MNRWVTPSSSSHFHTNVPIFAPEVVAPPKPRIFTPVLLSVPMKSSAQFEIHAEHRLSIPTGSESVSKNTSLVRRFCAWRATTAVIAIAHGGALRLQGAADNSLAMRRASLHHLISALGVLHLVIFREIISAPFSNHLFVVFTADVIAFCTFDWPIRSVSSDSTTITARQEYI